MENLDINKLKAAKCNLVPHVFSENYFKILEKRLKGKRLNYNESYYYSHFIKKKLQGMSELMGIEEFTKGDIRKDRIKKAKGLLKRYSKKHKGMKILISGSFLYKEKYNDIDIFVLSKYDKEDYRQGQVHVNYIPDDQSALFFKSIAKMSVANFQLSEGPIKDIDEKDVFHAYEKVLLLISQRDEYKNELRDFLLKLEYFSSKSIADSRQLDEMVYGLRKTELISKLLVAKIAGICDIRIIRRKIREYSSLLKVYKGAWNIKRYIDTYKEVIKIAS